jgi:vacuolar-type H+-ATPase catalytic subunit A/Vma1
MDQRKMNVGHVLRVSGPLVVASHMSGAGMYELVRTVTSRRSNLQFTAIC